MPDFFTQFLREKADEAAAVRRGGRSDDRKVVELIESLCIEPMDELTVRRDHEGVHLTFIGRRTHGKPEVWYGDSIRQVLSLAVGHLKFFSGND